MCKSKDQNHHHSRIALWVFNFLLFDTSHTQIYTIMPNIRLQSSDQQICEVDVEVAKKSETIKTMMEDLGIEETADIEEVVPLPNVTAPILKKVTQWAVQHKDDPPPPPEVHALLELSIQPWLYTP